MLDADALREGLHALAEKDAAHIESLAGLNDFGQIASLESVRYMRNQLLRDTDWVSMSHSLEIRVPLVDHVLSEALLGLAASGAMTEDAKEGLKAFGEKRKPSWTGR